MKSSTKLHLEQLEDRWCPALTATLNGTLLTISGSADNVTINITQDSTTAGKINVADGATAVGSSPFSGVSNIRLNLTSANDTVNVDLGDKTLTGGVTAYLGGGTDNIVVKNGTLGGSFTVNHDAAPEPRVGRWGWGHGRWGWGWGWCWGGGFDNAVDTGRDSAAVDSDATVARFSVRAGEAGADVNVNGQVTGNVSVNAKAFGSTAGTSFAAHGTIGGWLDFQGSNQADTLLLPGSVAGGVFACLGGGADIATVNGPIGGRLTLITGSGEDKVAVGSTVASNAWIDTGWDNDTVNITSIAKLQASSRIWTGQGNDAVTLDDAATITTLKIHGGSGTNTFTGTRTRTGLTLTGF